MKDLSTVFLQQALRLGRALHRRSPGYSDKKFEGEVCPACAQQSGLVMHGVLWPELVLQWGLSADWANWMDQREGLRCCNCHANLRSRELARNIVAALNTLLGTNASTLPEMCSNLKMQSLKVAEINAAGDLHPFLKLLPNLCYSEYGSTLPGVPSEDLLNLSYEDKSFHVAITSDVLEHVPDIKGALIEIRRILKPNGMHIFTVPVIWKQPLSRTRAHISNGKLIHTKTSSYHGNASQGKNDFLVFHEFGRDFVQLCEDTGYKVAITEDSRNPSLITFTSWRKD